MDKIMPPTLLTLSETGKKFGMTDDELIQLAKEKLGMDAEDAALMLAIERGETDGDVIEEK
jgi:hypothetical protein